MLWRRGALVRFEKELSLSMQVISGTVETALALALKKVEKGVNMNDDVTCHRLICAWKIVKDNWRNVLRILFPFHRLR